MSFENDPQNQPTPEGERVKNFFKRVWNYIKAAKMELIVLASFFAVDLISKALVDAFMEEQQSIVIIPYVLNFSYTVNTNAAFGSTWFSEWLGNIGSRIAFIIFAVAASAVFMLILVKNKGGNRVYRAGLAMLIAGALGNCVDRMFLEGVRDFIDMQLFTLITGGWWTYIFNIADCALVVGVILVIVYFIFLYDTEGRKARKAAKLAAKNGAAAIENAESTANAETDISKKPDAGENPSDATEAESSEQTGTTETIENTENTENAENSDDVSDGDTKDDAEGGA